jgi:hypothetical protein
MINDNVNADIRGQTTGACRTASDGGFAGQCILDDVRNVAIASI